MTDFEKFMFIVVVVGWVFNLGILWQMTRNHGEQLKDHAEQLKEVHARIADHHEAALIHTSVEWRQELRDQIGELSKKIDALQAGCIQRMFNKQC